MIATTHADQVNVQPDWCTADHAYQQHHFACAQCCAAGTAPESQPRCPDGQALLDTYNAAGAPPHFSWLQAAGQERNPA